MIRNRKWKRGFLEGAISGVGSPDLFLMRKLQVLWEKSWIDLFGRTWCLTHTKWLLPEKSEWWDMDWLLLIKNAKEILVVLGGLWQSLLLWTLSGQKLCIGGEGWGLSKWMNERERDHYSLCLNVCVSPKIHYVEIQIANVVILGGGAFERGLSPEDGAHMNGMNETHRAP